MHKTLYDELVGLLGKSHTNKDFKSFLVSRSEPVQVVKDSKVTPYRSASSKISHYFFPHFSLVIKDSMVSEIYAFINQPTTTTDAQFTGLPAGIISGDKRLDVQRKLGIKPSHSKIISRTGYTIDRYRLPPIVLSFWFAPNSQLMTEFRMTLSETPEAEA